MFAQGHLRGHGPRAVPHAWRGSFSCTQDAEDLFVIDPENLHPDVRKLWEAEQRTIKLNEKFAEQDMELDQLRMIAEQGGMAGGRAQLKLIALEVRCVRAWCLPAAPIAAPRLPVLLHVRSAAMGELAMCVGAVVPWGCGAVPVVAASSGQWMARTRLLVLRTCSQVCGRGRASAVAQSPSRKRPGDCGKRQEPESGRITFSEERYVLSMQVPVPLLPECAECGSKGEQCGPACAPWPVAPTVGRTPWSGPFVKQLITNPPSITLPQRVDR